MVKRNVYFPADVVDAIYATFEKEKYQALTHLFNGYVKGGTEYLTLDEEDASNLLRLADIEMSKAILKYPHNEADDPRYDPQHEEQYDDVMRGIYEKTYYYIQRA